MSGIETLNRAFSAALVDDRVPGAVPQAKDDIAPLALKDCSRLVRAPDNARSLLIEWKRPTPKVFASTQSNAQLI
jgi:hypothetical protein